jgi:hypothetical protein
VAELPATGDESKLYLTPKAHTTQTATGNPITATVAEDAGALESFQLDGDTAQQTYTGQNLYNVAGVSSETYVTKDNDGWITITRDNTSGSSTVYTNVWTSNLALETSTQYKIFIEVKAVSGTGSLFITSTNSTQGQFNSWQEKNLANMAAGQTYTVAPTTKSSFSGISQGLRTVFQLTAGQGGSVTFRLSVCASSTPTDTFSYEPYVGGQPSPNPDYPQPIQTVTGVQTISINGTDYPLDLGNIQLCGLGDDGNGNPLYKDRIYRDGDGWKVHKATGKVVFNGSENWIRSGSSTEAYLYSALNISNLGIAFVDKDISLSDRFTQHATASGDRGSGRFNLYNGTTVAQFLTLSMSTAVVADVDAFKTWLASNNTTLAYPLYTATDTTITDTTLIAQLEAIRTASLQNGANTITNTATGSNLAGDMEIGYYGYNPRNRYDKWLWLDINNEYEQIGS